MRVELKGDGQRKLKAIARQLEEKGNSRAIKRRLAKGIRDGAEPITREQRESLAAGLPKRGGAAVEISTESRLSTRTSYAAATVTITDSWPGHSMRAINAGSLRHPLFGDRRYWFDTTIIAGLLSDPVYRNKTAVVLAIVAEMDRLAEEIARGI